MAEIHDFTGMVELVEHAKESIPHVQAMCILYMNKDGTCFINSSKMPMTDLCYLAKFLDGFLANHFASLYNEEP